MGLNRAGQPLKRYHPIVRYGKPVVRLVRAEDEPQPRESGLFAGKIEIAEDFDAPLPDEIGQHFA